MLRWENEKMATDKSWAKSVLTYLSFPSETLDECFSRLWLSRANCAQSLQNVGKISSKAKKLSHPASAKEYMDNLMD